MRFRVLGLGTIELVRAYRGSGRSRGREYNCGGRGDPK
jgi:hypothetical protein